MVELGLTNSEASIVAEALEKIARQEETQRSHPCGPLDGDFKKASILKNIAQRIRIQNG